MPMPVRNLEGSLLARSSFNHLCTAVGNGVLDCPDILLTRMSVTCAGKSGIAFVKYLGPVLLILRFETGYAELTP
jgi:hypothetical protein